MPNPALERTRFARRSPRTFGGQAMHALLTRWLAELQRDPVILGPDSGSGADENLWAISILSDRSDITADQLVEFLLAAQQLAAWFRLGH